MGSVVGDNGNVATCSKNNSKMLSILVSHRVSPTAHSILAGHILHFTRGSGSRCDRPTVAAPGRLPGAHSASSCLRSREREHLFLWTECGHLISTSEILPFSPPLSLPSPLLLQWQQDFVVIFRLLQYVKQRARLHRSQSAWLTKPNPLAFPGSQSPACNLRLLKGANFW